MKKRDRRVGGQRGMAGLTMVAVLVVCAAVLPASSAEAQQAEVFLLPFEPLGPGVSSTVVSRVNENVQNQLRNLRVSFTTEVTRETGAAGGAAALREAQQEYQRGIGLYVVQDYEAAVAAFEAAVTAYGRSVGEIQDFRAVPDALFKLAESYHRTGNEDMARVTLMRAMVIRPESGPAEEAGQAYARFFESVAEGMRRQGRGGVTVESNPAGMTVIINGQEHGPAPATIEDLPAGEHYVQVRGGDGQGSGRLVTVQRSRTVDVRLDAARAAATQAAQTGEPRYLRSLREEVQRGTISDSLIPFMRELATRQSVEFVVVGVIVKRDTTYESLPFVYRASDGLFAEAQTQEYDEELANLTAHSYQQASYIQQALRRFPEDRLVTGAPIIAVVPDPVAAAPTTAEPVSTAPVMAVPVVTSTPTRQRPSSAPVQQAQPAPQPQPQQPAPQQPAQPQQQAWGAQPAQQPQPQQQAWGAQPAQPQQQAWGAQPAQPQQQAWGAQPAQPQQQAWGAQPQPQQQPAWGAQPQQQPQQPTWGAQPQQQQTAGGWGAPQQEQGGWGGTVTQPDERRDRDRDSVLGKPWFWGVVGGVVVAGTVTAIVLMSGNGDDGGVQPTLIW